MAFLYINRNFVIAEIMQPKELEKFVNLEKLGEGTYATVYRAEYAEPFRKNGESAVVALKNIIFESEDEGIPSTAIREISILKEISHPNVVKLKEVIQSKKSFCLVLEYVEYDLKKFMSTVNKEKGMSPLLIKVQE